MICPNCEATIKDSSKFCTRCGAKLEPPKLEAAGEAKGSVTDKPLTAAERRKNFFSSIGTDTESVDAGMDVGSSPIPSAAAPENTTAHSDANVPPSKAEDSAAAKPSGNSDAADTAPGEKNISASPAPAPAEDAPSFWDGAPVIESIKKQDTPKTSSSENVPEHIIDAADLPPSSSFSAHPDPDVEAIPDSDIEVIPLSEDGSPGFEIPPVEEEPVDKRKPLNKFILIAAALLTLAFLGGSYYIYHNRDGNLQDLYALPAFAPTDDTAPIAVENLFIPESEITLYQGQNKQISFEVYPETADAGNLQWHSSGGGVSINEAGRITGLEAGYEGEITLSDESGTITASAHVRVLTGDDALFETIDWIANKTDNQIVDLNAQNFKPKAIDPELSKVEKHEDRRAYGYQQFAQINEDISKYTVIQKQLVSIDTKNKIDCDIYMDTDKNEIRKIVAIEYYPNNLDITDYYYTDGKLCFLFNRKENYYRPVPANWGIPGSRLYFQDDAMTTWRETTKSGDDYTKIDYSYGQDGFEWDVTTYNYDLVTNVISNQLDELSLKGADETERTDKEKAYLALEAKSINNAYNIYNKLNEMPEVAAIDGHVLDATGAPIKNASVKVFSEGLAMLVSNAYTDENGAYSVNVPASALAYTTVVSGSESDSMVETTLHNVYAHAEASHNYQPTVYMFEASEEAVPLKVNLIDAITGNPVALGASGATLNVRPGINNKSGGPVQTFTLAPPVVAPPAVDSDEGAADAPEAAAPLPEDAEEALAQHFEIALAPGNYTGELVAPGFETCYFTISTLRANWSVQAVLMPEITDGSMRIVLNWSGIPADLDAHLFTPDDGHVAFNSASGDNKLVADRVDGYGPETIIIPKVADGTYKYYASDYTNLKQSNYLANDMANSGAVVSIYTANGLAGSFHVPRNEQGVIWHIFNISNGRIVPVQRYFNNIEDIQWWNADK